MAKVACDGCGSKFAVPDQYLGRRIRCPKCRAELMATTEPRVHADDRPAPTAATPSPSPGDSTHDLRPEAQLKAALVAVGRHRGRQVNAALSRLLPNRLARLSAFSTVAGLLVIVLCVWLSGRKANKILQDQYAHSAKLSQQYDQKGEQQVQAMLDQAAELRRHAAAQEGTGYASGGSSAPHRSVQDMMDSDPVVSAVANEYPELVFSIRRGEYPQNHIDLLIATGRMSYAEAKHVQDFCQQVRYGQ